MRLLLFLSLMFSFLAAELPPQYYDELQKNSPEILQIYVDEVSQVNSESLQVSAEIRSIKRSTIGLKEGEKITIYYTRIKRPFGAVGPSNPWLVKKDHLYTAYLKCDAKRSCGIAARGKSFEDEQLEPKKETAKNYKVMSPLNLEGLSSLDLRLFNRD